jgi:hypothetical protein
VVDQIVAWPLFALASSRMVAYLEARKPEDEVATLERLYTLFVERARPSWNLEGPAGPIRENVAAILMSVPVPLMTLLYEMWVKTFPGAGTEG